MGGCCRSVFFPLSGGGLGWVSRRRGVYHGVFFFADRGGGLFGAFCRAVGGCLGEILLAVGGHCRDGLRRSGHILLLFSDHRGMFWVDFSTIASIL